MTARKPKPQYAPSAADTFARRWVRRGHLDVVVADPSAALEALAAAKAALEQAVKDEDAVENARAVAAIDTAIADLDACTVRLWFQRVPNPAVAEEIRSRFPLTDEHRKGDYTLWPFWGALAAAQAAEAGDKSMDEDAWIAQLATWAPDERAELIAVLLEVLNKTPSADLPKG